MLGAQHLSPPPSWYHVLGWFLKGTEKVFKGNRKASKRKQHIFVLFPFFSVEGGVKVSSFFFCVAFKGKQKTNNLLLLFFWEGVP